MALPASILSGPSILYLGLAAHKYSNKIHLSVFLLQEMPWMKWRESLPHSCTGKYICVCTCIYMRNVCTQQGGGKCTAFHHFLPNSGFSPSSDWILFPHDIFSQPSLLWADWQIGGEITNKKHAGASAPFFKQSDTCVKEDVCAQKHGCTQVPSSVINTSDWRLSGYRGGR